MNKYSMLVGVFLVTAKPVSAAVISNFDFQSAWTGAKETNFTTFATNSPSTDTDVNSTTSLLSNSGFDSGGYLSFSYDSSVAGNLVFSTSATPTVGMNLGNAAQTTPTNYISFTVTPDAGYEITYTSLTLYANTQAASDQYNLKLVAIDGAGSPMDMGLIYSYTTSIATNEPVRLVTFDFSDFTSTAVTTWRIYGYNASSAIRFDDIILNGVTAALIPEPSSRLWWLSCAASPSEKVTPLHWVYG